MSEVHHAITAHVQKQHTILKQFAMLDAERERLIDEAVERCRRGEPFTVDGINEVTKRMNELAKSGLVQARRCVTPEMVREYVNRLEGKERS
ncbi:YpbS family protein [Geobacillus sp. Y412MC52]|uniref:YpbS family protein n=1 Tax=Geobacillus sp. (strain Y412MC52) TaxID=550542 RepID=UPI0001B9EF1C|nr:YpbS family protein [Geobacillus sp. Y412MC52]